MLRILGIFVAFVGLGLFLTPANASLYQPDEPMAVPVRPDGLGEPFPFDEFKRRLATLTNQLNPAFKSPDGKPTDRDKLLARVKERQGKRLTPDESAALAADLLRLGNTDAALDLLKPLYDDRERRGTRTYAVCAALIHTHAVRGQRGDFDHALDYMLDLFDARLPEKVTGWTDAQRTWFQKLDESVLKDYLLIRKTESEKRPPPETEEPTPLFAGKDAEPQAKKLPPDAIATVQQLLLWFPTDSRLYWLLAELYSADGKIDEALTIFDELASSSRQYSNRKVLMEHRRAITTAVEERNKAAEKAAVEAYPVSLRAIWIYFAAVVLIAVVALLRVFTRRGGKGGGGLNCCG